MRLVRLCKLAGHLGDIGALAESPCCVAATLVPNTLCDLLSQLGVIDDDALAIDVCTKWDDALPLGTVRVTVEPAMGDGLHQGVSYGACPLLWGEAVVCRTGDGRDVPL